jgi:hypothetical protein
MVAETATLVQEGNQQLIKARVDQLNYYHNFYLTMGVQASFIMTGTLACLTQVEQPEAETLGAFNVYMIIGSITVGLNLRVIAATTLIVVCAPKQSIHGPPGAVFRCVENMRSEQKVIFRIFIMSLISFGSMLTALYWVLNRETISVQVVLILAFYFLPSPYIYFVKNSPFLFFSCAILSMCYTLGDSIPGALYRYQPRLSLVLVLVLQSNLPPF